MHWHWSESYTCIQMLLEVEWGEGEVGGRENGTYQGIIFIVMASSKCNRI